jgi:large conductance mechanosensitive channel
MLTGDDLPTGRSGTSPVRWVSSRHEESNPMDPVRQAALLDARKKAFSLFEEFKNFAFKGNVIDLAVGVIIGAAFGKIVDSLVRNLIMPLIGVIMPGDQGYLGWKWVINGKEIPYGLFLGEVVNFLIVALALYIFIVKFLGLLMKAKKEEAAAPPSLTREQELLTEIRDLLKQKAAP